jgi:2-polyprenyl-3-methyl-5-hydroxy-6-metoxy-1,4-benzoquinol methylase
MEASLSQLVRVSCNTCGSDKQEVLFQKEGYNIVECPECQLIFVNPRKQDVISIYDESYYKDGGYYQNYIKNGDNYKWAFSNRIKVIGKYLRPAATILDIGCAYGFFLEIAQQNGFQVEGLEVNQYMMNHVKERLGVPCHLCPDLTAFQNNKQYDCITFFDSIEHLEKPKESIAKAWEMLKPEGILVITTPNIDSFSAKVMGKLWPHVTPEEHIYYYSPKTMTDVLNRCGFDVLHISGVSYKFKLSEFVPKFKSISGILFSLAARLEKAFPHFFQKSIGLNLGDIFVIAKKRDTK